MSTFLGVDIGGTGSRWVVVDGEGIVLERGTAPGAIAHLFNPLELERFTTALKIIAEGVGPLAPAGMCLGSTGLGNTVRPQARDLAGSILGIADAWLGDDMELAFRATFAPGEGHLISAGTGSIGVHLRQNGEMVRVGGRGLLIDDGGSGTWIGLRALDLIYRQIDETGDTRGLERLAHEVFAAIGSDSWDEVRSFVYGSDRGRIGRLAQSVASAADAGDHVAEDILREAAAELARMAHALIGRAGSLPVAVIGGIAHLHPLIQDELRTALPGVRLAFPQIDAALHAARWARDRHLRQEHIHEHH